MSCSFSAHKPTLLYRVLIVIFGLALVVCNRDNNCEFDLPGFPSLRDATSLQYLDLCGKNRPWDHGCEKLDCSCLLGDYKNDALDNFRSRYNNESLRGEISHRIVGLLGKPSRNRIITVMVVNYGYLFMFYNWLCSLLNNNILINPADYLLMVDTETATALRQRNVTMPYMLFDNGWYFGNVSQSSSAGKVV